MGVGENFTFLTPLINGAFGNNFKVGASATAAVINLAAGGGGGPGICTTLPNPSFTFSVSGFDVSLDASASTPNSGQCAISGNNWDMGDLLDPFPPVTGKTVGPPDNPPPYTYASVGSYPVTLEVTNQAGNSTTTRTVVIGSLPTPTPTATPTPTPTPTATPTPTPLPTCPVKPGFAHQTDNKPDPTVAFQGSYSGTPAPVTWSWDFGDGNTGTGQNPSHKYTGSDIQTNGKVSVTLTITNGSCQRSFTDTFKP